MRDPYQVLGVKPDISDEELKKAYRALVKKYHPDRYANSPMEHEAQEKLKDINLAYDTIQKMRSGEYNDPSAGYGGRSSSYGYGYGNSGYQQRQTTWDFNSDEGSARFRDIREMIGKGLIAQAEAALEGMHERPAEWYYLRGMVFLRRGAYASAQQHFEAAAQMDPSNATYRSAAEKMGQSYQQAWTRSSSTPFQMNSACRILATLACLSSCCSGSTVMPCCYCI